MGILAWDLDVGFSTPQLVSSCNPDTHQWTGQMDVYHITVIARGMTFDEDRHSIDAAKSWAADKLRELGVVPEATEYHKQGDSLVAEPVGGVSVTISPR